MGFFFIDLYFLVIEGGGVNKQNEKKREKQGYIRLSTY
jgi:hypothetical protein